MVDTCIHCGEIIPEGIGLSCPSCNKILDDEVKEEILPVKESKTDRFVRLSGARREKFLKLMSLFRNFSNTQVYDYTDEQVEELISMMRREIDILEDTLYHREVRTFTLNKDSEGI